MDGGAQNTGDSHATNLKHTEPLHKKETLYSLSIILLQITILSNK